MIFFPRSLRWRIQLWHTLLLAVVVTGFCVAAFRNEKVSTMRQVQSDLRSHVSSVIRALPGRDSQRGGRNEFGRDRVRPGEPLRKLTENLEAYLGISEFEQGAYYLAVWKRDGREAILSERAPEGLSRPEPAESDEVPDTGRTRGDLREEFFFTTRGECFLVGRSVKPELERLDRYIWRLTGIGLGVVVLGLLVGNWFTMRAFRPMGDIISTSRRIAAGDLNERITKSQSALELEEIADVLNDTFTRLQAAFVRQERFTADAAHELRTPIAVILTTAQASLAGDSDREGCRESLETCVSAARRLHRLSEGLIRIAAFEQGGEQSDRECWDLAQITKMTVDGLRPVALEQGVSIEVSLEVAFAKVDASAIEQVVSNLITNAIQHCEAGDAILVSTQMDSAEEVRVMVKDEGGGISAEHLPHLFERFYRVDFSRNRGSGGAGLGLSICQAIALAHGGRMTVESEVGKGSLFALIVPGGGEFF